MSNDPEYAEAIVKLGLPEPKERLSQWSTEREALAQIIDILRGQNQLIIAIGGAHPSPIQPALRPVTAIDAARERDRQRRYDELLERIFTGSG